MRRNRAARRLDRPIISFMGTTIQGDIGPLTCYKSKKGKVVFFPKSPPKEPPSYLQIRQRNRWAIAGQRWNAISQQQRDAWEQLTRRARLRISGINLFFYYHLRQATAVIDTLVHQTGIDPRLL